MSQPHKCPVCEGQGTVSRPPHVAGDVHEWTDTSAGPWTCHACDGKGVVWEPVTPETDELPAWPWAPMPSWEPNYVKTMTPNECGHISLEMT